MKKIEITEENMKLYQEYLNIQKGDIPFNSSTLLESFKVFGLIIVALGVLVSFSFITMTTTLIETLITAGVALGILTGIAYLGNCMLYKFPVRLEVKKFKKNHPYFNTNINLEELEKELNKYYTLSELPKDLEKQEEEHFSLYQEKKKEMTLEEQLIALEKEKTFLMQLKAKEELNKETQAVENYQKKKKI